MKKINFKIILFIACLIMTNESSRAQAPNFALVGFASENEGTTGGAGGKEIIVSNFEDLKKYAEDRYESYIIKVKGVITGSGSVAAKDYDGVIKVGSNKSIIGIGGDAFLDGIGLSISDRRNIIIQNLKFSLISIAKAIPEGSDDIYKIYSAKGDEGRPQILVNGGDLINISHASRNIWIDHCEFFSENPREQTNQDLYDGLLDVKNESGFITISWCYFHDHHKCSLIGSSDADIYDDRKITFHHNYYKTLQERVPLYRGGTAHFFNNYNYDVYSGSVNTREDACVRVEKNYFEDCKNAIYTKNSKIEGYAERWDNKEINCKNSLTYPKSCNANVYYDYSAVLTDVNDVKDVVIQYAGVGKLDQ